MIIKVISMKNYDVAMRSPPGLCFPNYYMAYLEKEQPFFKITFNTWGRYDITKTVLGSIPGRVIPKTFKMVLNTTLLNTQQYKVCIKGKEWRPPLHLSVVAIEKGAFWLPSTTGANFTYLLLRLTILKH